MKYFKGSMVYGEDRTKWDTCDICGNKSRFFAITEDYKRVCPKCEAKDEEHEFSEKAYGSKHGDE